MVELTEKNIKIFGPDIAIKVRFKLKAKCLLYNDPPACQHPVNLKLFEDGAERSFGQKIIFFRVEKQSMEESKTRRYEGPEQMKD